jgi:nuclear transport factor 2 (NTF2) superfamily protein
MNRPPLPPFTAETAGQKVRIAEDAWNTRDPARVALAYTPDCRWRNRAEFLQGRPGIEAFLRRKWNRELDYRPDQGTLGIPRQPDRRALRL